MIQYDLEAEVRDRTGKGVARKLRRAGKIPGVLYGPRNAPLPLAVKAHEFQKALGRSKGEQVLFTLKLTGAGEGSRLALVKELQRHPVSDAIRHVDFYEVFMDQEVRVEVPVAVVGKAKGVEHGGMLEILLRTVEVMALPQNIPNEIQVDVSGLDIGDALHVRDITPPEGVKITEDASAAVVTVIGMEAPEEAEEEEAEEGEEGEAGSE